MTTLTGILDWPARAEGRVRQVAGGLPIVRDDDPFVPLAFGERYGLRPGLTITVEVGVRDNHRGQPHGQRRPGPPHHAHQQRGRHPGGPGAPGGPMGGGGGGRGRSVVESIVAIEGMDPERFSKTRPFDELTSIDPQPRLALEYPGCPASCRLVDLFCPIGRGQRGLIVSPPKAGKTTLLKDIAGSLLRNHADIELIILLIDERPEEMTDFRRSFANLGSTEDLIESGAADAPPREGQSPGQPPMHPRCRVIGSSNDHDVEQHIAIATLTLDRCKRMVEAGRHVVVLLDSLTRLGRAFNRSRKHASSGRTMTGGIDSRALEVPKQIFGAARNTEEAGSLTILATCLVDTGSAGDQVIFEEFKGTGNMELVLDRKISERRLFPAINLAASGTRKEHLLMDEQELKTVTALRRRLINMPPHLQVEQLLAALKRFSTNAALVGSAG
jgi:transcription termination factor Rho